MRYAKEYGRKKILEDKMFFKRGWLDIRYSQHAKERLKQRLRGSIILFPHKVNISDLNIYKGYSVDGKYLYKVIIRMEYKTADWMYLVILPDKGLVKSVWFEEKGKRRRALANAGNVEGVGSSEEVSILPSKDMGGIQDNLLGSSSP